MGAEKKPQPMKLGEAVQKGIIANETLGYFIGRTHLFLKRIGLTQEVCIISHTPVRQFETWPDRSEYQESCAEGHERHRDTRLLHQPHAFFLKRISLTQQVCPVFLTSV